MNGDDVGINVGIELEFGGALASLAAVPGAADTRANEFEEDGSEKEPSKSISAPPEVVGMVPFDMAGIAIQRGKRISPLRQSFIPIGKCHK